MINVLGFVTVFCFGLIALYMVVKVVTVAILDAMSLREERNKNNGKES